MEATYYKDTIRSYMIIECPPEAETTGYQYRMLEMNRIEGLLSCGTRHIDGERFLYYDITGKQSLMALYEARKIPGTELFKFLKAVDQVSGSMSKYLLDEQHLVLDEEQVFYDFQTGSYCFTYYPGEITEPQVFRFLADGIDGTDKNAAAAAYRLCSLAGGSRQTLREAIREEASEKPHMTVQFKASGIETAQAREYEEAEERREDRKREEESGEARKRARPRPRSREEKKPNKERKGKENEEKNGEGIGKYAGILIRVLLVTAALGGAGGLIAVQYFLYISQRERRLCIAGTVLLLLAAVLVISEAIIRKRRERKKQKMEEEKNEPHYIESDEIRLPDYMRRDKAEDYLLGEEAENTVRFSERDMIGRLYGAERGNRIDLKNLPVTIGKAQAYADVILEDPSVSRVHARIYRGENGGIEIRDLDSTNGTWINGVKLSPNERRRVQRGDEVKFGNLEYEYR